MKLKRKLTLNFSLRILIRSHSANFPLETHVTHAQIWTLREIEVEALGIIVTLLTRCEVDIFGKFYT